MAKILIVKETKRVKYGVEDGTPPSTGEITLTRNVAIVDYPSGESEVVGDLNRDNAEVIEEVTLPEGFSGDRFDYIDGEFVPVSEPGEGA